MKVSQSRCGLTTDNGVSGFGENSKNYNTLSRRKVQNPSLFPHKYKYSIFLVKKFSKHTQLNAIYQNQE